MQNADSSRAGLMAIGIFKLIKGLLLVLLGIGVFELVHHDIVGVLSRWVGVVHLNPDNKYFQKVVTKLWSMDDRKLEEVGAGTFFYAGIFLTEGLGLVRRNAAGRLEACDPAVSTEYEPPSAVVRHFNQEMIGLAMSAPDRFPAPDREIGGLTLGLSRECYDRIKERIRMFKEDVIGMVVEDKRGSDLVAQLNVQLFPLAIPEKTP